MMYRVGTMLLLAALAAGGCRNMDNRRDARAAAFEPLRPAPEYRVLPNKPIHVRKTQAQERADQKKIAKAQKHASQSSSAPEQTMPPAKVSPIAIRAVSDKLAGVGLKSTVSKYEDHTVYLYLIAEKPIQGELLATALNQDGQEIARTRTRINMKKDDAGYSCFRFDPLVPETAIRTVEITPISTQN